MVTDLDELERMRTENARLRADNLIMADALRMIVSDDALSADETRALAKAGLGDMSDIEDLSDWGDE